VQERDEFIARIESALENDPESNDSAIDNLFRARAANPAEDLPIMRGRVICPSCGGSGSLPVSGGACTCMRCEGSGYVDAPDPAEEENDG